MKSQPLKGLIKPTATPPPLNQTRLLQSIVQPFRGNLRFLLVNSEKVKKNAAHAFITADLLATRCTRGKFDYLTFQANKLGNMGWKMEFYSIFGLSRQFVFPGQQP